MRCHQSSLSYAERQASQRACATTSSSRRGCRRRAMGSKALANSPGLIVGDCRIDLWRSSYGVAHDVRPPRHRLSRAGRDPWPQGSRSRRAFRGRPPDAHAGPDSWPRLAGAALEGSTGARRRRTHSAYQNQTTPAAVARARVARQRVCCFGPLDRALLLCQLRRGRLTAQRVAELHQVARQGQASSALR